MTPARRTILAIAAFGAAVLARAQTDSGLLAGGRIETDATAEFSHDSNIFLNSNQISDWDASLDASANYTRDIAEVSSNASLGFNSDAFARYTGQDDVDPFANGSLTYRPSDDTVTTGSFSYARNTLANQQLNTRTKSNDLNLSGSFQDLVTGKVGYRLTGSYLDSNYLTTGYADVLDYNAGLDAVYVYSPKLTLLAGYAYGQFWNRNRAAGDADAASRDSFYTVGAEGEVAPKVTGTIEAGAEYETFDRSTFNNGGAFFLSTGLNWAAAEKTTVSLNAAQNFDLTAVEQSARDTSINLGATQALDAQWGIGGSVAYIRADYQGALRVGDRLDNTYQVEGKVTYAVTTNVTFQCAIGYDKVNSTIAFSAYDRLLTSVSVVARF